MYGYGYGPENGGYGQSTQPSINWSTVLRMIRQIMSRESIDELTYDYLKCLSNNEKDEQLMDQMLEDERKHYDTLRRIYADITGQFPELEASTITIPDSYEDGLGSLLERKSRTVQLYVYLYLYSPVQYKGLIYPLLIDEQIHMQLINYLLIRKLFSQIF
ncbi:ferritin-like domain-containing protein [Alteribacter populi]|uniref:ferritin-like domain-containing protein n=1 Tax=Alteribacter populi TaxID=2011011 RepID=UPI000BBAEC0A|nr:ferritin-like domain-containing protein [Alteribacter populi]